MMEHILKCVKCSKYSMKGQCICGGIAVQVRPPKFSPEDAYAVYRRKAKFQVLKEKGMI